MPASFVDAMPRSCDFMTLYVTEASEAATEIEDLATGFAEQLQLRFVHSQPICLL